MSTDATVPAPSPRTRRTPTACTRTSTAAAPGPRTQHPPYRPGWHVMVMALMMLTGAFSVVGLALPSGADAATLSVDQCNGHGPGAEGATTAMTCTVTVVNTISGATTHSSTTVTRLCTLGPCSTPNGTFTTTSTSLVTDVRQCNSSDNDAAHAIRCSVTITNLIGQSTPGARTMTAPRVSQCVGSAKGGGGVVDCSPATRTGAMVTQCNGSGNGGGGAVHCSVDSRSRVSRAIPVRITQCNGTGNVGGSSVSCTASIITRLTKTDNPPAVAPVATPSPTSAAPTTTSPGATPAATPVAQAPLAAGQTGNASPAGSGWEGLLMIGAGLTLVAAIGALLFRRFGPQGFFGRFDPRKLAGRSTPRG